MHADRRADALGLDSTPRRREDVTCVELEGETVVYAGAARTVHKLDPVGTAIWNCLDGTATLRQIADELASAFEGDGERIAADVVAYANDLDHEGLLA